MELLEDGVTQEETGARGWKSASKAVGCGGGKSPSQGREPIDRRVYGRVEFRRTTLPRKASNKATCARTKTDTGRRGEDPKVRGKTLVKELGKSRP